MEDGFGEPTSDTARRIFQAALHAFAERGFHATTIREISRAAGLSAGSIYSHYATKEDLLYQVCLAAHRASVEVLVRAVTMHSDSTARLAGLVRDFARWHIAHPAWGRVAQYEFENMSHDHTREVIWYRRQAETIFVSAVSDAMQGNEEQMVSPVQIAGALLSLCIDIVRWRPIHVSRENGDDIPELYARLACALIHA